MSPSPANFTWLVLQCFLLHVIPLDLVWLLHKSFSQSPMLLAFLILVISSFFGLASWQLRKSPMWRHFWILEGRNVGGGVNNAAILETRCPINLTWGLGSTRQAWDAFTPMVGFFFLKAWLWLLWALTHFAWVSHIAYWVLLNWTWAHSMDDNSTPASPNFFLLLLNFFYFLEAWGPMLGPLLRLHLTPSH